MYDNSHVPSYNHVSSRPCRIQHSRWSLDTPAPETSIGQPFPQPPAILSSSFYFPPPQRGNQVLIPNYVNYYPSPSSLSSSHLSSYQRPKSTILHESTSTNQSTYHVNDFRPNHESKAIVGIVKPMVFQRSCVQLNNNNNNNNNNNHYHHESKIPEVTTNSYYNSTRSLYPQPTPTSPPPSSTTYRSRLTPSYNNINGQPPMAPRRHSSISNSKCLSSYRSSRTTSTSSSITAVNELSSAGSSSHESDVQQNDDKNFLDVKRLEMFYGSVGTLVKSARSRAYLYTTTTRQIAGLEDWSCQQSGVPVWIYNTGANLKRARQVRLVLAQHESCFAIWSNLVSTQAEIRSPKDNYITCWLPDATLLIVLKFERDDACRLFFQHYYEILNYERRLNSIQSPSTPSEKIIEQPRTNHKEIPRRYSRLKTMSHKQDKEQQQFELRRCRSLSKIRTVKKSAISGPINFEHVNHISINGGKQARPFSGTTTLRSLHASMSHLPSHDTCNDRFSKQNRLRASTVFEPRATAV